MIKKIGIIKRVLCIGVVFLLSINSFAAVVSDSDGSAFITKAEFDALKSSFQAQIDSYNQSIDSKIDGAIASYLAGIIVKKETILDAKLNVCYDSGYYFDKDWSFIPSELGDKAKLRMVVAVDLNNDSAFSNLSGQQYSVSNNVWEIVWGSIDRDNPKFKVFGTKPDKFISYRPDPTYAGKVIVSSRINSVPSVSVVYAKSHTALSVSVGSVVAMASWTETKGTETAWGSFPISHSFDPFGATRAQTIGGVQAIINEDEMFTIEHGLPVAAFSDKKFYGLKIGNEHLIGNAWGTKSLYDCGTNGQYTGGLTWSVVPYNSSRVSVNATRYATADDSTNAKVWKATLYRHKYDNTYYYRDINLQEVSAAAGEYCTYGDGLPLFYSPENGRVQFILDTGILNSQNFEIRDSKFNNTNINSTPFATMIDANANITKISSTATNTKWEIAFDTKANKTYYIVCSPTISGKCYVKIEGDIKFVKKD